MTTFDEKLNFGAKIYPKIDAGDYIDEGACEITPGVEIPVAPNNAMAILEGIPGPDFKVLGGTPSYSALSQSLDYLKGLRTGFNAAIIFITDGQVSCFEPPAAAIEVIADAWNQSTIPTYVVGIDVDAQIGSELDQFALAGGKPLEGGEHKFYQATDQLELQAAMQSIVDDSVSCILPVAPEPSFPELFEVWISDQKLNQIDDCANEDGWHWITPHIEVELCGSACLELKQVGEIEAKYFCLAG